MYKHMTYADVAVLLALGFKLGTMSFIYWGTAKDGTQWQVLDEGRWLLFAQQLPTGNLTSHERMSVEDFGRLFR